MHSDGLFQDDAVWVAYDSQALQIPVKNYSAENSHPEGKKPKPKPKPNQTKQNNNKKNTQTNKTTNKIKILFVVVL